MSQHNTKTTKSGTVLVYNPYFDNQEFFLGYIIEIGGQHYASPDKDMSINREVDSVEDGIRYIERFSGCHL